MVQARRIANLAILVVAASTTTGFNVGSAIMISMVLLVCVTFLVT